MALQSRRAHLLGDAPEGRRVHEGWTYLPAGVADEMPRLGFAGPADAPAGGRDRARLIAFEVFGADGASRVLFVRRAVYRRVLGDRHAGSGLTGVKFKALGEGGEEPVEWDS